MFGVPNSNEQENTNKECIGSKNGTVGKKAKENLQESNSRDIEETGNCYT